MARPLKYTSTLKSHSVEGLDQVMRRYREAAKRLEKNSNTGMIEFALHIRRRTETKTPYTPKDTGNLRASWFVAAVTGSVNDPMGESGNFKTPRKGHLTKGELAAQHRSIVAASLAEVRSRTDPNIIFGYSAGYALAVHEKIGAENWSRPGSGPKWLEAHLNSSVGTFTKIMKKNTEIL